MQGYMLDWPPLSIYIIATAAGEQYYQYVAKCRCVRLKYLASTPFAPSIKVLKCLSGGPCLTISAHITVCLFQRTILQTGNVQIASRINMLITLGYCRLCLEFSAFSIHVGVYLKIIQTKEQLNCPEHWSGGGGRKWRCSFLEAEHVVLLPLGWVTGYQLIIIKTLGIRFKCFCTF